MLSGRYGLPNIRGLRDPYILVALTMRLWMSTSSERSEERTEPRYVNVEVKVMRVPSERVIGAVSARELGDWRRGTWRTSVFDLEEMVPVCIFRPNFFKWFRTKFAVRVASSLLGRINALSSTYSDIQWDVSVPFDFVFCPDMRPRGAPFAVLGKKRYLGF